MENQVSKTSCSYTRNKPIHTDKVYIILLCTRNLELNYDFKKMNNKLEYFEYNNIVIALGSTLVFSIAGTTCH